MATVATALNRCDPNEIADLLKKVEIGSILDGLGTPVEAEALSITAHVHTLAYKPMAIIGAVHVTTGNGSPLAYKLIPKGQTPATHEAVVDLGAGTISFLAADAVTAGKVSYVKRPTNLTTYLAATWPAA